MPTCTFIIQRSNGKTATLTSRATLNAWLKRFPKDKLLKTVCKASTTTKPNNVPPTEQPSSQAPTPDITNDPPAITPTNTPSQAPAIDPSDLVNPNVDSGGQYWNDPMESTSQPTTQPTITETSSFTTTLKNNLPLIMIGGVGILALILLRR